MDEFLKFVGQYWVYWLALAGLLGLLYYHETVGRYGGVKLLSASELALKLNRERILLLDQRAPKDFEAGHILGAVSIMPTQIEDKAKKWKKYKDKPVIIISSQGANMPATAQLLRQAGLTELYGLRGGMAAWRAEKLPVVKDKFAS